MGISSQSSGKKIVIINMFLLLYQKMKELLHVLLVKEIFYYMKYHNKNSLIKNFYKN